MAARRGRMAGAVALAAATVVAAPAGQTLLRLLADAELLGSHAFIMGGTDNPGPTDEYMAQIENLYLRTGSGGSWPGRRSIHQ